MKQVFRFASVVFVASLSLVLVTAFVQAGGALWWDSTGVPMSTAAGDQTFPQSVSDGSGGAIIAWQDFRSGNSYDIYAQRVNAAGQVQWTANGASVSAAANDQQYPQLTSDGQGGAIIVWQDTRNGSDSDIFAQHMSSDGVALWNTDGITISAASGVQDLPQIASDGQGGALIVWQDNRSGDHYEVYAQRVSSSGSTLWTAEGVNLGDLLPYPQSAPHPVIINDDHGGGYVAWEHSENYSVLIRAQRVLSSGTLSWASGGITVSSKQGPHPQLVPDGAGGAIIAWGSTIYAQRLSPTGTLVWGGDGTKLGGGYNLSLIPDGAQGAFAGWQEYIDFNNSRIIVQHVLSDSTLGWVTTGVTTTSQSGLQQVPHLVADGYGGVIVVWQTTMSMGGYDYAIWSQRLNQTGIPQWGIEGLQVISHTAAQMHSTFASDLAHGGIVAWEDERNANDKDIFAQRLYDFLPTNWIYLPTILR